MERVVHAGKFSQAGANARLSGRNSAALLTSPSWRRTLISRQTSRWNKLKNMAAVFPLWHDKREKSQTVETHKTFEKWLHNTKKSSFPTSSRLPAALQ